MTLPPEQHNILEEKRVSVVTSYRSISLFPNPKSNSNLASYLKENKKQKKAQSTHADSNPQPKFKTTPSNMP